MSQEWTSTEPGLGRVARELVRLRTRAMSRKWKSLFITLLVTGAVVGLAVRKPRKFEAGVVITITAWKICR